MSFPTTIVPRLVIQAADVADVLADLAADHDALSRELEELTERLAAFTGDTDDLWSLEDVPTASAKAEILCNLLRTTELGEIDAMVEASERSAAERVAAAQQEASQLLASAYAEAGQRLVGEVGPHLPPPAAERVLAAPLPVEPPPEGEDVGPVEAEVESTFTGDAELDTPGSWGEPEAEAETEAETDHFRAFWSEHDNASSAREIISAPLMAIAPMAVALLVIILALVLVV